MQTTVAHQHKAQIRELCPLLFVQDIRRSIIFYCEKLGFDLRGQGNSGDAVFWCRLERDACALMLQQAEAEDGPAAGRGRGIIFYFGCDDADQMHAELIQRGLELPSPKTVYYGMRQVTVPEPDGYHLCFTSPIHETNKAML